MTVTYSIEWSNPYTEPPCGDRVLSTVDLPDGSECPKWMKDSLQPGSGYSLFVRFQEPEPRRLSKEGLASVRRKRLRARLDKSAPLFADELFDQEIERNPSYYAGERDNERT